MFVAPLSEKFCTMRKWSIVGSMVGSARFSSLSHSVGKGDVSEPGTDRLASQKSSVKNDFCASGENRVL